MGREDAPVRLHLMKKAYPLLVAALLWLSLSHRSYGEKPDALSRPSTNGIPLERESASPPIIRIGLDYGASRELELGSTGSFAVYTSDGDLVFRGRRATLTFQAGVFHLEIYEPRRELNLDSQSCYRLYRRGRYTLWLGDYFSKAMALRSWRLLRADLVSPPRIVKNLLEVRRDRDVLFHSNEPERFDLLSQGGYLTYNGVPYRGVFHLFLRDGKLTLVNELPIEEYLYSVVGGEMPSSWHLEALKSQAVAARSYALAHLNPEADFDLCATALCQLYTGLRGENWRAIRAVEETQGIVATYGGRVISTFYSANAGGVTEDVERVWSEALPYLRSVPSPADAESLRSPWGRASYRWEVAYREDELIALLERRGIRFHSISDLVAEEITPSGRVTRLRIEGPMGPAYLIGDEVRLVLDLKSNLFTLRYIPEHELEIDESDRSEKEKAIQAGGRPIGIWMVNAGILGEPPRWCMSRIVVSRTYRIPSRVTIEGRGYGHGVGMSQWGAEGMARQGKTYRQILKHYYRGILLVRNYNRGRAAIAQER